MNGKLRIIVSLIGILMFFGASGAAGVDDAPWEFNLLRNYESIPVKRHPVLRETSTLKTLVSFTYGIWVKYITPYDGNKCAFHPTCATYVKQAIERHGFIKGTVMGSERLQRCHCWTLGSYPLIRFGEYYRFYDPVKQ